VSVHNINILNIYRVKGIADNPQNPSSKNPSPKFQIPNSKSQAPNFVFWAIPYLYIFFVPLVQDKMRKLSPFAV